MNEQWIQLSPTCHNDGLLKRDGSALDPATLPISDELRERLATWCNRLIGVLADVRAAGRARNFGGGSHLYDKAMALVDSMALFNSLDAEGLAIARALKAELPTWTVYYYDVATIAATDCGIDLELGVLIEST